MNSPQRKTSDQVLHAHPFLHNVRLRRPVRRDGKSGAAQVPTPTTLYGFQQALTDAASPYGVLAQ